MEAPGYLDFDLCIERTPDGYCSEVLASPSGQARAMWSLPFSELELENMLLRLGGSSRTVRGANTDSLDAAKRFGSRLFEAVFDGDVRGCLQSSIDEADERGLGLRIRLRLAEAGGVADLPWEYMYNQGRSSFLALSRKTPVVRFLDLPGPPETLRVELPLRILTVFSSPADLVPLEVEREWAMLRQALGELQVRGLVTIERLERPTVTALQDRLLHGTYHVLHFVGHGSFDEQRAEGALFLEDDAGRARRVAGDVIGTLLHDHDPLRLVVLNACEGARSSALDPLAGVAQCVVRQGVPAVVAMQFAVSDQAAIVFARAFYGSIAGRYPVDAALAEARKAMYSEGSVEWGTPVLYLRAPDGAIFDVAQPVVPLQAGARRPAPSPVADASAPRASETAVPAANAEQRSAGFALPAVAPPDAPSTPAAKASRWPLACLLTSLVLVIGLVLGSWMLLRWTADLARTRIFEPGQQVFSNFNATIESIAVEFPTPGSTAELSPTGENVVNLEVEASVPALELEALSCDVLALGLNLRRGPATSFDRIAQLSRGRQMLAVERSGDGRWVHVLLPDTGQDGWVSASADYVSCAAAVPGLPVGGE